MSENDNMEYRGLCCSCKNAVGCYFRKHCQKPSFYCEEFEIDSTPFVKTIARAKSLPTRLPDAEEKASKSFGLCSNCENRKTCVFQKPEGGIWHCEEYQ